MITDEMIEKLIAVYKDKEKYFRNKKRKKELKIIVESLIEQLSEEFLKGFDSSIGVNLIHSINKLLKLNSEDLNNKEILISLKKLIKKYDKAFEKDYSDHSNYVKELIEKELREVMLKLCENSSVLQIKKNFILKDLLVGDSS